MKTDAELLAEMLTADAGNVVVRAMLVDELMGSKDMLRSEAEAHADRIEEAAVSALLLARAEALMVPDTLSRRIIERHLRHSIGFRRTFAFVHRFESTDKFDFMWMPDGIPTHDAIGVIEFALNPKWVVSFWEGYQTSADEAKKEKRRKRAK